MNLTQKQGALLMTRKFALAVLVLAITAAFAMASSGTPAFTAANKEAKNLKAAPAGPDYSTPLVPYAKRLGGKIWHVQEGFEGSWLPAGWDSARVSGTYATYLTRVTSGTYPTCTPHSGTYMVKWYCYLASAGNRMRLIAPPVRISSPNDSVSFWMTHSTGYASANDRIIIEKMVKSGGTWGSWTAADSFSRYEATFRWGYHAVPLGMHNGDSVRISFTCHSMYGDNIYMDDVAIGSAYTPTVGDLELYSIDAPSGAYMEPSVAFGPAVTVNNPGSTPVTDYFVYCSIDDGSKAEVYRDSVFVTTPDSIQPGASLPYTFANFTPMDLTNYNLTAWVVGPDDIYHSNDTLGTYFRTFNELVGNITDDNNGGAAVEGAKVKVVGPATDSTYTDVNGDYFFFDLTAGTYDVTASKAGYTNEVVTGMTITDLAQTTLDMSMGYPELVLSPMDSIYVSLPWDTADSTTWQFTLENTGARDMTYNVAWPESTLTKGSKAPVSLVLDDGTVDNNIGIGGTLEFIWVNRFTPAPAEFPFQLQQVQAWFSTGSNLNIGDDIQVVVYLRQHRSSGGLELAVLLQHNHPGVGRLERI